MLNKRLKTDKKYHWTNHALQKMAFYRLTESRVKKIFRSPQRVEEGIAPETNAAMQRNDTKKRKEEIWVMWQKAANKKQITANKKFNSNKIIISAWRYPGISPAGKRAPVPDNILEYLESFLSK